ncbi:MAG: hypothetical protein ACAI35_26375 [Candidatus Methylacidiphilales bacterium]
MKPCEPEYFEEIEEHPTGAREGTIPQPESAAASAPLRRDPPGSRRVVIYHKAMVLAWCRSEVLITPSRGEATEVDVERIEVFHNAAFAGATFELPPESNLFAEAVCSDGCQEAIAQVTGD